MLTESRLAVSRFSKVCAAAEVAYHKKQATLQHHRSEAERTADDGFRKQQLQFAERHDEIIARLRVLKKQLDARRARPLSDLCQRLAAALRVLKKQLVERARLSDLCQRLAAAYPELPLYQRPWTAADWQPFAARITPPPNGRLRLGFHSRSI